MVREIQLVATYANNKNTTLNSVNHNKSVHSKIVYQIMELKKMPKLETAVGRSLKLQGHSTSEHQQNLSLSLCKNFHCTLKEFLS